MTKKKPVTQPIFIGIVGASGAGKTTLCRALKKRSRQCEHVKLDNYFKNPELFPKKFGYANWEKPSNIKFDLLLQHLKMLRSGRIVKTQSFPTSATAKPKALTLKPKEIVLVEGFILLANKQLRDFLDVKIFLDIPAELMLGRRMIRFREKQVNDYDVKVAVPEFLKLGVKQKQFADYVIDATQSPETILQQVEEVIINIS